MYSKIIEKITMRCPQCIENGQESMTFPANNIELSQEIEPFYDEHGNRIAIKQVALSYACSYGHVFKLAETNFNTEIDGNQELRAVQEAIQV